MSLFWPQGWKKNLGLPTYQPARKLRVYRTRPSEKARKSHVLDTEVEESKPFTRVIAIEKGAHYVSKETKSTDVT